MYPECGGKDKVNRRGFLALSGGAAALLAAGGLGEGEAQEAAPEQPLLPTIDLGEHKVTRMIAGYNPIGGHSHTTLNMARHMREYFTAEQTAEFLLHCGRQGINTWQYDHTEKVLNAIRIAREKGSEMQLISLHAERGHDAPLPEVMKSKPI
ncbi:MAG TPA: twin-arginine translocation signal domain-containing protein, partial [Armatimonadota bacterium]|nr:twin-arginine translocation signal domain-containing protein [Armatimonadota bacterium]